MKVMPAPTNHTRNAEICSGYLDGHSQAALARQFELSHEQVRVILFQYGLHPLEARGSKRNGKVWFGRRLQYLPLDLQKRINAYQAA